MKAWVILREECEKVTRGSLVSVRMRKEHYGSRRGLIVAKKEALKKNILYEAHTSRYSIHPGSNQMYHDLRQ
jgi:hypothetical protein